MLCCHAGSNYISITNQSAAVHVPVRQTAAANYSYPVQMYLIKWLRPLTCLCHQPRPATNSLMCDVTQPASFKCFSLSVGLCSRRVTQLLVNPEMTFTNSSHVVMLSDVMQQTSSVCVSVHTSLLRASERGSGWGRGVWPVANIVIMGVFLWLCATASVARTHVAHVCSRSPTPTHARVCVYVCTCSWSVVEEPRNRIS